MTGRNVEIPDHYRVYVGQKLARVERLDSTIQRFNVELEHENNRRQRKNCQHVEITAHGSGPVVRGEGCADSFTVPSKPLCTNWRAGSVAARTAARCITEKDSGVIARCHRRAQA